MINMMNLVVKWPMKCEMKCECGGTVAIDSRIMGVTHTQPTCKAYDKLDVDELIQTPGALALYVYRMTKRNES
jgi:hypothetical protein